MQDKASQMNEGLAHITPADGWQDERASHAAQTYLPYRRDHASNTLLGSADPRGSERFPFSALTFVLRVCYVGPAQEKATASICCFER